MRNIPLTPEQLASVLNGREIGDEISNAEAKEAAENGLVVVFGASDDLCEFQGAISDEAGCYCGCDGKRTIRFTKTDIYVEPDRDELEVLQKFGVHELVGKDTASFEALWCAENMLSWTYNVPFPHATFEIKEGNDVYCRGFVFRLADAFPGNGSL